jgi:hypothetical protein
MVSCTRKGDGADIIEAQHGVIHGVAHPKEQRRAQQKADFCPFKADLQLLQPKQESQLSQPEQESTRDLCQHSSTRLGALTTGSPPSR